MVYKPQSPLIVDMVKDYKEYIGLEYAIALLFNIIFSLYTNKGYILSNLTMLNVVPSLVWLGLFWLGLAWLGLVWLSLYVNIY